MGGGGQLCPHRVRIQINPQKVYPLARDQKHSFGDLCVSPGSLDDLARDLGESVLESVIALKPANCPEPIAKCRASVPTRFENPVMASRPGECVKVAV